MEIKGGICLVTGGAGFIGSHICDFVLEEEPKRLIILDNFSSGREENIAHLKNIDNILVIKGDIRDGSLVDEIVKKNNVKVIFHIAAYAGNRRSNENPRQGMETNICGTLNILEASRNNNVEKIIYASSSGVYGNSKVFPIYENFPTDPQTPYTVSKLAGENYCRAYYRIYDLPTVCLRFNNIYGPREYASEYTGVICRFIERVLEDEAPIITGTGNETRDYTYVTDLARAVILASKCNDAVGEVFNIGTGVETKTSKLANMIIELSGKGDRLVPEYTDPPVGEIFRKVASIDKAKKFLGYEPKITLKEGLKLTFDWYKEMLKKRCDGR